MSLLNRLQTIEDKFNKDLKNQIIRKNRQRKFSYERNADLYIKRRKVKLSKSERNKYKKEREYKRIPKQYQVYIKSKWWTKRKNKYYQENGRKCAICNSSEHIQLHHLKYGNFGEEKDQDLLALCRFHHTDFHDKYSCNIKTMYSDMTEYFMDQMDNQVLTQLFG
jgi:hypothetical protein